MRSQIWHPPVSISLEKVLIASWLSARHFKISNWVFFTYALDAFQTDGFALGSSVSKSAHEPFKSKFSFHYSSLFSWTRSLLGFQSLAFRRLVSVLQNLRVGMSDVEHKPLTPQGKVPYFEKITPSCGPLHVRWGVLFVFILGIFCKTVSLPLLPILMLFFLSIVVKDLFIQYYDLFQRKLFHM